METVFGQGARIVRPAQGAITQALGLGPASHCVVECLRAGNSSGDVCPDSRAVLRRKLSEVDECLGQLLAVRQRLQAQLEEQESWR